MVRIRAGRYIRKGCGTCAVVGALLGGWAAAPAQEGLLNAPPGEVEEREERSEARLAGRSGSAPGEACVAVRGRVIAVPVRAGSTSHRFEAAVVAVTVQRSAGGLPVTVWLGSLSAIASQHPGLRIGRRVRIHCSTPTLELIE